MGFYEKWMDCQSSELVGNAVQDMPRSKHFSKPACSRLPEGCPFITGGSCPDGCRFESRLFNRMVRCGVLPYPTNGCPLLRVCGLNHYQMTMN